MGLTIRQVIVAEGGRSWTCRLGPTYRSMDLNARKVVDEPWGERDRMARWRVFRGQEYLVCDEAKPDWPARLFSDEGLFMVDNPLY